MRFLCNVPPYLKFTTFQQDDRFAALQIELLHPRVERDVGPLAWLDAPSQFPDYVRSTFQRSPGPFPAEHHNHTKPRL